jgi:hypothetical protein
MRIDEVTNLKTFLAQVRANGAVVRTSVYADNLSQARAMLSHLYGLSNLLSLTQVLSGANESAAIKPETPAQAWVRSLSDQAAQLKTQAKKARAQIGLKNAQARVQKANSPYKAH